MTHPDAERYVRRRLGATTDADRDAERRKIVRFRPSRPQFSVQSEGGASLHDAPGGLNFLGGGVIVDGDVIVVPSYGLRVGGAPSIALAGAAGTPSLGADSTDEYGQINFVTTAAGLAAGGVVTITFGAARANNTYIPVIQAISSAARTLTGSVGPSRTTLGWTLSTPVALAASTTYQWGYHIRG